MSGGLDSSVLLHEVVHIPELTKAVSVVHVNHGLSPHASDWEHHCRQRCQQLAIPFTAYQVAIQSKSNIEEEARLARYAIFESILETGECLLLAQHSQDQAETVLLQLCRGTGVDGLAAMPVIRVLGKGRLIRPLLNLTRQTLSDYALSHQLSWIEDDSNNNPRYSRNYIRQFIIPMLEKKWPNVVKNILSCSNNCQDAKKNLDRLAYLDCHELTVSAGHSLSIQTLPLSDQASLVNVLRVWIKNNEVQLPSARVLNRIIQDVILARIDATPLVSWNWATVRRYQGQLYLLKEHSSLDLKNTHWTQFPSPFLLTNNSFLQAMVSTQGVEIPDNSLIEVRFRQSGESLRWHGQTKTLKKLFQQWHIPPWQRHEIPLIFVNNCLKVVVGFAVADPDDINQEQCKKYIIRRV